MKDSEKVKRFPNLFCPDCIADETITCERDKDAKCLHCGVELCAHHISKHLQDMHQISVEWRGVRAEPKEFGTVVTTETVKAALIKDVF